jgi:transcriptional regulator with XRE-family HTH domain
MKMEGKIEICMKAAGYNQKQLANAVKVSPQAVSLWIKGKANPSTENLIMMCETLNVPIQVLVDETIVFNTVKEMQEYVKLRIENAGNSTTFKGFNQEQGKPVPIELIYSYSSIKDMGYVHQIAQLLNAGLFISKKDAIIQAADALRAFAEAIPEEKQAVTEK